MNRFVVLIIFCLIFTGKAQQQQQQQQQQEQTTVGVSETKTVCKITSGDVEATAEATISRNIDGVCKTEELQRELRALELKLMQELINIKAMLAQQLNVGLDYKVPLPPDYLDSLPPLKQPPESDTIYFPSAIEEVQQEKPKKRPEMKNLVGPRKSSTLVRSRESEIHTFNNTVLKAGDAKIFTYFWKLENFSTHLSREEFEVSSPVFSIEGLNLRAIATYNYMHRDFLNIRIEEVSEDFLILHKQSSIRVETDNTMSGIFHRIEVKKQFKHKIIIMDQGTPATDLISQDFFTTNGGFAIPTSAIHGARYVKDDTVLIRIVIYI